ncbi:MAG: 2-C-methyl-D-erythritol 4-phosphate cytidylyltransferase [Prevotellaceae bacterium]|jgi:2-C-methyl-D-erythritol 4-phosphate cytidylyltransferase|nr:2-C-methyl-D-erythritol 4-phosphate cytidylyltransferase [Prevotellaceae bacterium]
MKRSVIIVAGGSGQRMGTKIPKQFLLLAGMPVLMHAIRRFHAFDPAMPLIVALPPAHIPTWTQLCAEHCFTIAHTVTAGGGTRFESVKKALDAVHDTEWIAVHDGVRPLVSPTLIARCFETAALHGAAAPVVPLADSVRMREAGGSRSVLRDNYCIVQTPQIFRAEWLKHAYRTPFSTAFTDDASVVEAAGYPIALSEGSRENIKITDALDLKIAEQLLMW